MNGLITLLKKNNFPYKISCSPLYKLSSKSKLCKLLKLKQSELSFLLSKSDKNYKVFEINQSGKSRQVQEPKELLDKVHKRLHKLLSRIKKPHYIHSATKKLSYLSNSHAHLHTEPNSKTITVDIKSFFQNASIKYVRLFLIHQLGCSHDIARKIAKLATYNGHLPTGSSLSPVLSFYAYKPMFDEIVKLAHDHGIITTLYVDDLTFSGTKANEVFLKRVRNKISDYGLTSHKIRRFSANQHRHITGVIIDQKSNTAYLPHKRHRKISLIRTKLQQNLSTKETLNLSRKLAGRLFEAHQVVKATQGENNKFYREGINIRNRIRRLELNKS